MVQRQCVAQAVLQQSRGGQAHGTDRAGTGPDKMKTTLGHPTLRSADGQSLQTKRAALSLQHRTSVIRKHQFSRCVKSLTARNDLMQKQMVSTATRAAKYICNSRSERKAKTAHLPACTFSCVHASHCALYCTTCLKQLHLFSGD